MVINAKCNDCEEPTKYVVGFFDGKNGIHGCLYDCHNEECTIKQIMEMSASKDIQERAKIQLANDDKDMYAGYIAALRRDAKVSMFKMAQIAGCSSADYSAYEYPERHQHGSGAVREINGLLPAAGQTYLLGDPAGAGQLFTCVTVRIITQ